MRISLAPVLLALLSCTKPQLLDHAREPTPDAAVVADAAVAPDAAGEGDPIEGDGDASLPGPCATLVCDPRASCEVGESGAHCVCPDGFSPVPSISPSVRCEDVDECQSDSPCDPSARCVNTLGGHYCDCGEDQALDSQGKCVNAGDCVDGDAETVHLDLYGKGRVSVSTSRCTFQCPCEAGQFCMCSMATPIGEAPTLALHLGPYTYFDDSGCMEGEEQGACALRVGGAAFWPAHNLAFVSAETYTGNLGGLEGADKLCNDLAKGASLSGEKWMAILTDGNVYGRERFAGARGFLRTDGLPLIEELSTSNYLELLYPLELDEYGQKVEGEIRAWTGTWSDNMFQTCKGWTSAAASELGNTGDPRDMGFVSEDAGRESCDQLRHLYCASSNLVAPFPRVEFPGRLAFVTPTRFVPGGTAGKGLERADAACQRAACRLGLTGIDDAELCTDTPGTFRTFRAMLSTSEVSAMSRLPERDEPWVDITRHPITRTGADLALGLTLTGFREPGFQPHIGGRDHAFAGFVSTPGGLADPDTDCNGWTESGALPAYSLNLWRSGTHTVAHDCAMPYGIVCLEE